VFGSRFLCALAATGGGLLLATLSASPQNSTPDLKAPVDFDLPAEMTDLYGNYDSAAGLSIFVPPPVPPWNMITGAIIEDTSEPNPPDQKLDVRAFFLSAVPGSGNKEVLLATFGVPDSGNFDCHACAPFIGAALFKRGTGGWTREASEPPFLPFGLVGRHPDAKLVQYGPHRYGIQLESRGAHQGNIFTTVALLLPWNGRFRMALRTETLANNTEDESAECRLSEDGPDKDYRLRLCYAYHRKLKFVPGRDSQYYDLVVTTSGKDFNESGKVVDISGTMRLRLVDGKYRPD